MTKGPSSFVICHRYVFKRPTEAVALTVAAHQKARLDKVTKQFLGVRGDPLPQAGCLRRSEIPAWHLLKFRTGAGRQVYEAREWVVLRSRWVWFSIGSSLRRVHDAVRMPRQVDKIPTKS